MINGDQINDIVATAVERGQAPGVVAAVAQGDATHVTAAGVMAVGGAPMQDSTLFRISSVTKPVTAAVILSMIDDGLLRLDDPVDKLLPELAGRRVLRRPDGPLTDTVEAERAVCVRDLLTFTWGFGMQGAMFMATSPWPIVSAVEERELASFGPTRPSSTPGPDIFMARLGELPLLAQPGERWLYQLGPLGMGDTAFHAADPSRLATAYEGGEVSDPPGGQWSRPPRFPDGGGGLVSTVVDLVAFGRMLLRGGEGVLRPQTVAEMTRDQLTPAQRAAVWPGFSFLDDRGWGYGTSVLDDGSYGWEGGSGTAWFNVPERDLTVVVLTQRAADETGMPAVCADVVAAARG